MLRTPFLAEVSFGPGDRLAASGLLLMPVLGVMMLVQCTGVRHMIGISLFKHN